MQTHRPPFVSRQDNKRIMEQEEEEAGKGRVDEMSEKQRLS